MTGDRSDKGTYYVSRRLLARKGGAGPLQARGEGVVLARDPATGPLDDQQLTEAVMETTLDLLTGRAPRGKPPKAVAALTDLYDPALVRHTPKKP